MADKRSFVDLPHLAYLDTAKLKTNKKKLDATLTINEVQSAKISHSSKLSFSAEQLKIGVPVGKTGPKPPFNPLQPFTHSTVHFFLRVRIYSALPTDTCFLKAYKQCKLIFVKKKSLNGALTRSIAHTHKTKSANVKEILQTLFLINAIM